VVKEDEVEEHGRPVALTIAGSDSGGGAGIQADLKTFQRFGVFGTSAITAVTAQNTLRVEALETVAGPLITAQITTVCRDLSPAATKTGMLADARGIEAAVRGILECGLTPVVVDPVMVATSGARLLATDAIDRLRAELLPLATLVTPNLPEAEILSGHSIPDQMGMSEAARRIVEAGAGAALIKGGHGRADRVIDLLWDGTEERIWQSPRLETRQTHGTGCTLSAAITACLALGLALPEAVATGLRFTHRAIAAAPGLGHGHGPLNHWVDPGL